jgi:hypothetical protein
VSAVASDPRQDIAVASEAVGQVILLTPRGVLDATTYLSLRDRIIKAALDDPSAVIVDVSELFVPRESAWAVFTSARWHVERWPEVPIALVCAHRIGRDAVVRNGVARYVPVFPTVESACNALALAGSRPRRRRARVELPADFTSLRHSRTFVAESLQAWSIPDLIAVAQVVATAFVENVLQHTDSPAGLRLETDGATVTVAVEDASHVPAGVHESSRSTGAPSGLSIVNALCRIWGNSPMPSGKTVWAIIGPENRL